MIINKDVMRDYNERSVLQAIINYGPISRNDISKRLGLNKVTVSDIVAGLIDRQWVYSFGEAKSTSSSGRKAELVEYNSTYGYIVNFSVSKMMIEMLVTKLDGRTLDYQSVPIADRRGQAIVDQMIEMVTQLPSFDTAHGLQAISIAIFGVVYHGEIISSPFVDWEAVDLVGLLRDRYHVPVMIENEANLAAIFEQDFSKQELDSLVAISIHEGIGAGIIINTQLYTGNYGQAGEIGRLLIQAGQRPKRLADLPSFDAEWSQEQVLARIRAAKGVATYSLEQLVTDYELDDPLVRGVIDEFCYHLALVTSDLLAAYDPQLIFFNSPLVDQLPEILKNIQMKLSFMPLVPPLVMSKDVKYATLLGGASLAIHQVLGMTSTRLIFHH